MTLGVGYQNNGLCPGLSPNDTPGYSKACDVVLQRDKYLYINECFPI